MNKKSFKIHLVEEDALVQNNIRQQDTIVSNHFFDLIEDIGLSEFFK